VNLQQSIARRVAVVGGGISGLAAAHRLAELDPTCRISLFDRAGRLGGVLSTVHEDGFQVEQSADNFITTFPWGLALCGRLGLQEDLIQTTPEYRRTFVVRRGRLYKLPDGFLMMAPTRLWPMAVTPILSPWGKLRAALEYFIPPRRDDGDESMAAFVRRRLGREVFDRLVEPLVSAVYAADMERLSVEATLSRFREMEREHGSLIRAMRRAMKSQRHARESGARYSMFVTLRGGLSSLIDALAARLPEGSLRLNTEVRRMQRTDDGWQLALAETSHAESRLPDETFDAVILAAPSHVSAELLRPTDARVADDLAGIEHSGTAIVTLAFDRNQIAHPLDGMGAVVPAIEQSPILAVSFSSQKYAHRAPEGKVLLRAFVGGARRHELAEMPERELVPLVLGELRPLLGIGGKGKQASASGRQAEPCYVNTAHWPRTMPQYHVGHRERIARVLSHIAALPNVELAGNVLEGVGIPNCIHTGELAAERALAALAAGSAVE
jgi:oxygen-dependent protoporphyrinogen oxidase